MKIRKLYHNWRYYLLGHDEYNATMRAAFKSNINALQWANCVFFILALLFSISPIFIEKNYIKTGFYIGTSVVALFLFVIASHQKRQLKDEKLFSKKQIYANKQIYALVLLYYINVMVFGLFLAVWAEPEKIAGSFIGIFICVLFLFNISPLLYLCLTIIVLSLYTTAIINVKIPAVWNYDIQNALFAGAMSLIFGWQIIMNRLTMISADNKLREESTIDELTQLKNRRDFMRTFQRFITNHRQTDKFFCIAILDVDRFKNYNDHYGHPQGDECLRKIGMALKNLQKSDGIYSARIGGEEFALLWHIDNLSDANNMGLHINQIIRDLNIPHEKSDVAPYISVSAGIHIAQCGVPHDMKNLFNLADKALYAAKNNGRNCAVISS